MLSRYCPGFYDGMFKASLQKKLLPFILLNKNILFGSERKPFFIRQPLKASGVFSIVQCLKRLNNTNVTDSSLSEFIPDFLFAPAFDTRFSGCEQSSESFFIQIFL